MDVNIDRLVEANKNAFKDAFVLEAGETANKLVLNTVAKKVPAVEPYKDNPFAKVVVANAAAVSVAQFLPENEKAAKLTNAMVRSAAINVSRDTIQKFVDEILASVDIDALEEKAATDDENV